MANKKNSKKKSSSSKKVSQDNRSSSLNELSNYSKNLSDSANSVRSAAQIYDKASQKSSQVIKESLSQLQRTLNSFAKSFSGVVGGSLGIDGSEGPADGGTEIRNQIKDAMYDGSDEFNEAFGEQGDKLISNGKLLISTLEKSLMRIVTYALGKIEEGFNSVVDEYNSSLTTITTRLSQTNHEYSQMLYKATDWISKNDLKTQFSQIDFERTLIPVLETGIRGGLATEMTYRNMITNKLMPMIQTNTKAYTRMSKTLGASFDDATIAMGTYTEQLRGAEGLEEGRADALLEEMYREILISANGNEKLASENWQKLLDEYNMWSNSVSKDYADYWLDTLTAATRSDVNNVVAMGTVGNMGVKPGDVSAILANLDSYSEELYNTVTALTQGSDYNATYMAQAGVEGLNLEAMRDLEIYRMYGDQSTGTGKKEAGAGSSIWADRRAQGLVDDLKDGFGQSITDQQKKFNENLTADAATWAAEHIPDVNGSLNVIKGILGDIFNLLMAWKFTDILGGGSGDQGGLLRNLLGGDGSNGPSLLGKLFNSDGLGSENLSFATKFADGMKGSTFINGGTFMGSSKLGAIDAGLKNALGTTGGTGFGGASTIGGSLINFAAGPGALIAGTVMGGVDAYQSIKNMDEDATLGSMVGEGTRAFFTGHKAMNDQDKLDATEAALRGERRKMDWGAVGMNALKGGALGAGIGTAAGGWAAGLGTAVGAGVGAITGAVASVIDQAIENAKYNKLAEATEQATEAFDKLSQSQSNYAETVKKGEDYQKLANELLEIKNSGDEDQIALAEENFKLLQDAYPDQLGKLKDLSEFDEKYIEVINNKIEREKALEAQQMKSDTQDALNAAEEVFNKFNDITSGSDLKSQASLDFIDAVLATGGENGETWSADKINETLRDVIKNNYGLSEGDEGYQAQFDALVKELNSGESGEVFHLGDNGEILGLRGQKGHGATSGDNMAQFKEDYGDSSEKRKQASGVIDEYKTNILQAWNSLAMMAEANQDPDTGDFNFSEGQKQEAKEIADSLAEKISGVRDKAEEYGLDYKVFTKEDFPGIEDIYEAVGSQFPSFKVGSYEIPYDDFIAKLHEGEMVLTKQDADTLRGLVTDKSKLGVSGFLSFLLDSYKSKDKDDKAKESSSPFSLKGLLDTGKEILFGDENSDEGSTILSRFKDKIFGSNEESDIIVDNLEDQEGVSESGDLLLDKTTEIVDILKDHFGLTEKEDISKGDNINQFKNDNDEALREKKALRLIQDDLSPEEVIVDTSTGNDVKDIVDTVAEEPAQLGIDTTDQDTPTVDEVVSDITGSGNYEIIVVKFDEVIKILKSMSGETGEGGLSNLVPEVNDNYSQLSADLSGFNEVFDSINKKEKLVDDLTKLDSHAGQNSEDYFKVFSDPFRSISGKSVDDSDDKDSRQFNPFKLIDRIFNNDDNGTKSVNVNEEKIENYSPIVNAIAAQTEVISKINNQILSNLVLINRKLGQTPSQAYDMLVNYSSGSEASTT